MIIDQDRLVEKTRSARRAEPLERIIADEEVSHFLAFTRRRARLAVISKKSHGVFLVMKDGYICIVRKSIRNVIYGPIGTTRD